MAVKKSPTKKQAHQKKDSDLHSQLQSITEALQRERADAENMRRRHAQDIKDLKQSVKVEIVSEILPVIDNFERSLKHVPSELEDNEYIKGVQAIVRQFDKVLTDMGVGRIATVGTVFDPNLHEAVSMDDTVGGDIEIVCEELQSGYYIEGQVVRPAMVRVKTKKS
jgi:molecular chaperone GrpE